MISSSSNVKNQRNHQSIHSLLHNNFTIISSRSAILHSFIELLCIFHVNCCLLFVSWWSERENIPFCVLIHCPKALHWMWCNLFLLEYRIYGSWMHIIFSIHGKWSSWWSNSRLVITQPKSKIVLCGVCKCSISLFAPMRVRVRWCSGVCYGNHPVLREIHALHWKDCVKVFLFETSGINHLCLMFLWENRRYGGIIITWSWENCVFAMNVS